MIRKDVLDKTISFAKQYHLEKSTHDWMHIIGVVAVARILARKERADIEVVTVAGYLHDIGYTKGDVENHNEFSVKMARPFLKKLGLPQNFSSKVLHAILHHKRSWAKRTKNKEARVLCDADKIDTLGSYGFLKDVANQLTLKKLGLREAVEKAWNKNQDMSRTIFTKSARKFVEKEQRTVKALYNEFSERAKQLEKFR